MAKNDIKKVISKQASAQAVPSTPPEFISKAIEEAKAIGGKPSMNDDGVLVEGAASDFWKMLKGYIERKIDNLDKMTNKAVVAGGWNLEEAGLRFILKDQITHFGKDIIEYVEMRTKAHAQMVQKSKDEEQEKAKQEKEISERN